MSCLRELFSQETSGVVGTLADDSTTTMPAPFEYVDADKADQASRTVRTLGIRPAREMLKARSAKVDVSGDTTAVPLSSFEAHMSARVGKDSAEVGLELVFDQGKTHIDSAPYLS